MTAKASAPAPAGLPPYYSKRFYSDHYHCYSRRPSTSRSRSKSPRPWRRSQSPRIPRSPKERVSRSPSVLPSPLTAHAGTCTPSLFSPAALSKVCCKLGLWVGYGSLGVWRLRFQCQSMFKISQSHSQGLFVAFSSAIANVVNRKSLDFCRPGESPSSCLLSPVSVFIFSLSIYRSLHCIRIHTYTTCRHSRATWTEYDTRIQAEHCAFARRAACTWICGTVNPMPPPLAQCFTATRPQGHILPHTSNACIVTVYCSVVHCSEELWVRSAVSSHAAWHRCHIA
jgi:hypothetical protein